MSKKQLKCKNCTLPAVNHRCCFYVNFPFTITIIQQLLTLAEKQKQIDDNETVLAFQKTCIKIVMMSNVSLHPAISFLPNTDTHFNTTCI